MNSGPNQMKQNEQNSSSKSMKNMKILIWIISIAVFAASCNGNGETGNRGKDSTKEKTPPIDSSAKTDRVPNVNTDPSRDIFQQPAGEVQEMSLSELDELLSGGTGHYDLIDVRTPEEWEGGVIGNPKKINFRDGDFEEQIFKLPKDRLYTVYCAAGGRSSKAVSKMKELGFQRVYSVTGGFDAWKEAGKEVKDER